MNETITVLIGTLSGFIIAFFAEPVKNYFQQRAKLHNLRVALYKEILHNDIKIGRLDLDEEMSAHTQQVRLYMMHHSLRAECYKNALQNELPLFYQLNEAAVINELQGSLAGPLMDLSIDSESINAQEPIDAIAFATFRSVSSVYRSLFAYSFYNGTLDGKILQSLVTMDQYREIMKRGKEEEPKRVQAKAVTQ